MAEEGLPAPTPKPVKAKIPAQTKAKATHKPTTSKTNIPLEVVISPVDCQEDQDTLHPPNQLNQLPDIPAALQDHIPNPPNAPNPPNPAHPPNPPNPPPMEEVPPQLHQLNWSYCKPAFSGKTEEDAVAHLLKTNDWMDTHNFPEDTKVRRFCLTLIGEARLWYESMRPIEMDWEALQECFRHQYF